jgi:hypothetical protein
LPKKGQHWLWIAALIIVFFIGYTVGANTHAVTTATLTATATPVPTRPVATPTPPQIVAHYQVGQTLQIDGTWQVAITTVHTSSGDQYTKPKPGNTFLLIEIAMKNISSQQLTASSLIQYTLRDTTEQTYSETPLSNMPSPDGTVQAGADLKGTLVYEVPATIHTYTLSFISSVGRPPVIWDVQH